MSNAPGYTHSQVMTRLQEWVRSTDPEIYKDDSVPFGSGTVVTMVIYHVHLVSVVNDRNVVNSIRDICAGVPASYEFDLLLKALKDVIYRAVLGRGILTELQKSVTSPGKLLKQLDIAERQAKVLSRLLERLQVRIPEAAFGVDHLSRRLAMNDVKNAAVYSVSGWGRATKKSSTDVLMTDLLRILSNEVSDQAARIRAAMTTTDSRQARSKKKFQRTEAIALLQTADQSLNFSIRPRLKPHHNFVHAVLRCLWGDLAVERSYISRLSTELKTRAKKV